MKISEVGQGLVQYSLFLVLFVEALVAFLSWLGWTDPQIEQFLLSLGLGL